MSTSTSEQESGAAGVPAGARVYDLSLPFNRDMPTFEFYRQVFPAPFFAIVRHPALTDPVDGFVTHVSFITHTGTHVDAPRHFRSDGAFLHEIPPDRWLGQGPVIGIAKGPCEEITAADLERSGADVRRGDIVAINTGWHHRYCGPATDPEGARVYLEQGPGLCAESARWLVEHGVKTVMVDTPALDAAIHMPYGDGSLQSHRTLFAENIPGVEMLGGELDEVTGRRCLLSCAPVKYEGGDAFPLRALAIPLA
jgi:kynurenine formamidase